MSMQINVDPAGLTQEQREAVAGFILAYPSKACGGTCHTSAEIHDNTEAVSLRVPTAVAAVVAANPVGAVQSLNDEIAQLAKEGGEFDASVAFGAPAGDAAAAAVFGSTPAPLPLGATAAPFTAGVDSGVDLDKTGVPWDGRIHAESKTKIADGTWRKKRGVDAALIVTVEGELRQVMGAPVSPTAPAAPVAPPPPAPLVQAAPPVGSVPQDARAQFVGLVGRASAAIQAGKVTQAEITQCCAAAGVPALPLLANRLDLVAQVAAQVDAMIAAR